MNKQTTFTWDLRPKSTGYHWFRKDENHSPPIVVNIEHGPSSGFYCKELKQGGSIHCGFKPWEGEFQEVDWELKVLTNVLFTLAKPSEEVLTYYAHSRTKDTEKPEINKKENLEELLSVCEEAVAYVGMANYAERQSLAEWNVRKAFDDFTEGKKPQWVEI